MSILFLTFFIICATEDIDDLFRKALKDNDEPMAVLTLADPMRRGGTDLRISKDVCKNGFWFKTAVEFFEEF